MACSKASTSIKFDSETAYGRVLLGASFCSHKFTCFVESCTVDDAFYCVTVFESMPTGQRSSGVALYYVVMISLGLLPF
jgi:hypothetical protein